MTGPIEPPIQPYGDEPTYQPYAPPPVAYPPPYAQPYPQLYPPPQPYLYPSPYGVPPDMSTADYLASVRRRNRRTTLIVSVIAVVAVVAVGVALALTSGSPKRHPLTAPDTLAGYVQTAATDQIRSFSTSLVGSEPGYKRAFEDAAIGAYARTVDDPPAVILIAIPTQDIPSSQRGTPDAAVRLMLQEITTTPTKFPNAMPGLMECGSAEANSVELTACGWADDVSYGVLITARPAQSFSDTASIANEARRVLGK